MTAKKSIPFPFVMDALFDLQPVVKPMFGAYAIYLGEKIMLILRQSDKHREDNGVWIATYPEHHESLKSELPSMRSIGVFGPGESAWQNIPIDSEGFEIDVFRLCDLIHENDPRIGKIPAQKKAKKK